MNLSQLLLSVVLIVCYFGLTAAYHEELPSNQPSSSFEVKIEKADSIISYATTEGWKQISSEDRVGLATKDGECSNNPANSACNQEAAGSRGATFSSINSLDTEEQLKHRIDVIDQLGAPSQFAPQTPDTYNSSSTLRQVLLLHRHGDRTPINFPPNDNLKDEPFWAFHGYGQLTNRGKKRLYLLGNIMRRRYGAFLDNSVNKNFRSSRASGSLRCIESAQVFLSSFLRLDLPRSSDSNQLVWDRSTGSLGSTWQPASIQTTSSTFDGMLAESADCARLMEEYQAIDATETVKNISANYAHEAEVMLKSYGMDMDHFYKWFWAGSQIEVESSYFPDKMKPEIMAIFDRMQEASILAFGAYQSTLVSKRLRSGLLITDMVQNMKSFRAASHKSDPQVKKFLHYTAHDMTNIVLLGMLDNWYKNAARPNYASSVAIELHHDTITDQWFVRFFYMRDVLSPESEPKEIFMDRCSSNDPLGRCSLDRFEQLMIPYMIDSWQSWMRECGNNLKSIDPYKPGK